MKRLFSRVLWTVLTAIFCILMVALIIGTSIAFKNENAINMTFGVGTKKAVNASDDVYFSSDYDKSKQSGEERYKEDAAMIEEAAGAGTVLLWNKSNALPLDGGEKVSCFGHASVSLVESGSGSGWSRTYDVLKGDDRTVTLKDALTSRGFEVNGTLWDVYESGAAKDYKMTHPTWQCVPWQQWEVNEAPWQIIENNAGSSFAQYGDVAIVTLSRLGGEYSDLHYNYKNKDDFVGDNDNNNMENTSAEGGYLGLSDEEDELLTNVVRLKNEGTFKKVVLLLNTGNPVQMKDVAAYYEGIDACMWIGQPGSTGINAVADILKGKINPSGRLPDTWVYDLNSAPATVNDGNYLYGNDSLLNGEGYGDRPNAKQDYYGRYMVYQEGIYVGYRYYETRYADCVNGKGNASSSAGAKMSEDGWDYASEVAFPFGYGLSYTTFEYSDFSVSERLRDSDGAYYYNVSVTVTNTGDVDGKEVVQVYLQKPYTDYDKKNGIEKSAVELVGYAKTDTLKADGGHHTLTIKVEEDNFKTYDANVQKTYILEEGDYYLTVAANAHAALNKILGAETDELMGGNLSTGCVSDQTSAAAIYCEEDFSTYSVSEVTGEKITNRLDSGDINKYENRGTNSVTYLSRSDWDKTYPAEAAKLVLNKEMAEDLKRDTVPDDTGYTMPEYQQLNGTKVSQGVKVADVNSGDRVAFDFINAPLDERSEGWNDEWQTAWDELLDQMSQSEQIAMVSSSFHKIHGAVSIALPESYQENGPVGITKREDTKYIFSVPNQELIEENGFVFVAYPCAGILAASFDTDIAQRVGEHKSEDMLYLGYNGIYGPGVNMHRSPFGGRAFEYPSEDPYLAGVCEAYETIGIQSKGCMAYAKHFALNDMETNRINCGVWSNEQASREIYLRAFEIVFKDGGANATMSAYTRIGTKWNGACKEMMTDILRGEWGYDGITISDWVTKSSGMSLLDGVMAGTDSFDANNEFAAELEKYKDNAAVMQAVRNATKRLIYNVVRTNAMNNFDRNTYVISVTPWWKTAVIAIDVTVGVLAAASAGMLVASLVIHAKRKKSEEPINKQPQVE